MEMFIANINKGFRNLSDLRTLCPIVDWIEDNILYPTQYYSNLQWVFFFFLGNEAQILEGSSSLKQAYITTKLKKIWWPWIDVIELPRIVTQMRLKMLVWFPNSNLSVDDGPSRENITNITYQIIKLDKQYI